MNEVRKGETELNTEELPALPSGWCWTTLATIAVIEGGITKDQKRKRTSTMREVPYLRVANVQRGRLDLEAVVGEVGLHRAQDVQVRIYSAHPPNSLDVMAIEGHLHWKSCPTCPEQTGQQLSVESAKTSATTRSRPPRPASEHRSWPRSRSTTRSCSSSSTER